MTCVRPVRLALGPVLPVRKIGREPLIKTYSLQIDTELKYHGIFWLWKQPRGLLMKTWKLLLNRMNITPSCKFYPANTCSTVMWFVGAVGYFYCTVLLHACSVCALVKLYYVTAWRRVRYRRTRATSTVYRLTGQFVFFWGERLFIS